MKHITIADILTPAEIERAKVLYTQLKDTGQFAKRLSAELVEPNLGRINRHLGQENDSMYLAYVIEYVLNKG